MADLSGQSGTDLDPAADERVLRLYEGQIEASYGQARLLTVAASRADEAAD